ncbi:HD domain-containing protein [Pseudonocardia sp. ICBG1034]|uniref:HD domain-containing protein n=1 Tax=Pseudonocardia sp. ICBG1034 TaxID=2844381 RepID=UPI001CCA8FAD|nr:HD domain-containing protein [Pseudonocardia sp. ICBG1034]
MTIQAAYALAEASLAEWIPLRWRHVRSVHTRARQVGRMLTRGERRILEQSALLHDIGYSPFVAESGFHPLDGARYLQLSEFSNRVVNLVANHSCARIEARLRKIGDLQTFPDEATATRDALWYCDATTGPSGESLTPDERWAEVRRRYGPDHLVSRFLDEAEPELRAAIYRTRERMLSAGLVQSM